MNEILELRKKLEAICERTKTDLTGIKALLKYYTDTCGWTEEEALNHTIELFENGTIDQIKLFGKDGEELYKWNRKSL